MEEFIPLSKATLVLEEGRHPLEIAAREHIDVQWQRRVAANPRLYDGDVVLATSMTLTDGVLSATCRAVRYAGLLHFLGLPEVDAKVLPWRHIYCWAAIISGDGKAIMGRMAGHTANAGRIFFPSGSLEACDFQGGVADIDGNMARELAEETGLVLARATPDRHYLVSFGARTAAIMRIHRFEESAADLVSAAQAHMAQGTDDEPETVLAFAPGETDPAMAPVARHFMERFKG